MNQEARVLLVAQEDGSLVEQEVTADFGPEAVAYDQSDLALYAGRKRMEKESGGTLWNGWRIYTDTLSQSRYMSEVQAVMLGVRQDGDLMRFADDVLRPVTNEQIKQIAVEAREFVKTCMALEMQVLQGIKDGAITTFDDVDAAFG